MQALISVSLIDSTNRIQRTTCQDIQCVTVLPAKQQLRGALRNRKGVDLITAWIVHIYLTGRYVHVALFISGNTFSTLLNKKLQIGNSAVVADCPRVSLFS